MATRARKSTAPIQTEDDPFKYGWRYVKRTLPDGTVDFDQIPLTLEDVLHPEEEDFIVESDRHDTERAYLKTILRARVVKPPVVRVCSDLRIDWGVRGLRVHGPDVAVIVGLKDQPPDDAGTLYLGKAGGRCILVVEITSPSTRSNDVGAKLDHYHRAKVGFYGIVDQEEEGGPRAFFGYRWTKTGFKATKLASDGSLLLSPVGLRLRLRDNHLVCFDAESDHEYLPTDQNIVQLEQADRKIQEQDKLLEESVLLQQEMREEFERRFREQEESRLRLEERVRQLETQQKPTKRTNGRK